MTPVFTLCFFLPVIARNKVTKQSVLLFRKLTCHCEEHSDEAIRFSFYALPGYGSRRSARDDTGFYVVLLLTCRCGEQSDEAIRFSLYVLPGYGSRRSARDDTGFYVALLLTCHCEERSDEAIRFSFYALPGYGSRRSARDDTGYINSRYKSFHSGFICSISLFFFFRLPPLICFSRLIAVYESVVSSK